MGFDEKLFSIVYRFYKGLRAPPKAAHHEFRASLESLQSRLHLISKSLCGEPIQILRAENTGGFSGFHFYYPDSFCPFPQKEKNEWLYLQRTVYYYVAKKNGFVLPAGDLSDIQKKLYSCLAVHQTNQAIKTEFPQFWEESQPICLEIYATLREVLNLAPDTQNGLLAHWITNILCGHSSQSPWGEILSQKYLTPQDFWRAVEDIHLRYFSSLPLGPSLPPEVFVLWGLLMPPAPLAAEEFTEGECTGVEALANGTEIPGKPRDETVLVHLEKRHEEKNPVMHSFEKIETLEEYDGGLRTQDGDDSLQDHAEALDELNIKEVTRSRERTNSIYKADIRLQAGIPEILVEDAAVDSKVLLYPEWDYLAKSYKPDWCRVEVRKAPWGSPYALEERYHQEKKRVLKIFDQVRHRPLWQKRQRDGVELDIDAVVNRHAELKSGTSSEDRLYLRNKKHKKDFQCLLLLDVSLSTDSWIANERVLDVIKNSVSLIGEAFAEDPEAIAVAAFHSNTRHQCTFEILKGFKDPVVHLKKALTDLEPQGYTRIGPALRHGLELLKTSSARHKLIFLLSDGKASDYDRYEGRYGMEDIKQTSREARRQRVHIKCLAIEENAKFYLPKMFGKGNVHILSSPRKLPSALTSLFLPLLR